MRFILLSFLRGHMELSSLRARALLYQSFYWVQAGGRVGRRLINCVREGRVGFPAPPNHYTCLTHVSLTKD